MAARSQLEVHVLARDDVLVGVVDVVVVNQTRRGHVPRPERGLVLVERLEQGAQLVGLHAFCFSLQVMHTRVHGMAFNRAAAISSPQSRHAP